MHKSLPSCRHFCSPAQLHLDDFARLCEQVTRADAYPLAERVESNVPVYAAPSSLNRADDEARRWPLLDEWHHCLLEGPGVLVIEGMFADDQVIDAASAVFLSIIKEEKAMGGRGDHFAPAGHNDRIWNAFQKHGLKDPDNFLAYYANPLLALVSEAWLGPYYQLTSQVNVVNPGGQSQRPHRDYHLGLQARDAVGRFPLPMHQASQLLTLQGAIAHGDMPVTAGPTQLLPYSHRYPEGYLAYHDPAFQTYFSKHYVQLPLGKGDGVFFNPALFHAAGANCSDDIHRMANLLQISSAFGRPMEAIDTRALIEASYPALSAQHAREGMSSAVRSFIAAVAEGYSFPVNLDQTPPEYGMAPESEQGLLERALCDGWGLAQLRDALQRHANQRRP